MFYNIFVLLKQSFAQTICVRYTNERVDQNFEQAKNLITAYLKTITYQELNFFLVYLWCMKEIFKNIEGYEGYQVSNLGNVKSLKFGKEKILKQSKCTGGYLQVRLKKEGKYKSYLSHRLVAKTFIPNPNNYPQINHKDEDKTNNSVINLEWCTNKQNCNYGKHKNNISNSLSGKQRKSIKCVENDKIYKTLTEAALAMGGCINTSRFISECCRGLRKTYKSFHWEYAEV